MISCHHHYRFLDLAGLLQGSKKLAHLAVETLNLEVVVSHIAAHFLAVGKMLSKCHGIQIHAGRLSGILLVAPVRIVTPKPKGEGAIWRTLRKKNIEIVILLARRISRPSTRRKPSRPPAFSGEPCGVASLLKAGLDTRETSLAAYSKGSRSPEEEDVWRLVWRIWARREREEETDE